MLATTLTTILRRQGAVEAPYVFSPSSLFASGETGVWYEPADFSRYTADSTLGPELVTNGSFDTDSDWSKPTGATISGGILTYTAVASGQGSGQSPTISAGKTYKVSLDVLSIDGNCRIVFGGTIQANFSTVGTKTYFIPTSSTGALTIQSQAVSGLNATFDNISVRELTEIDTATLFQDTAGTTPVTAVEQPVGLMLDKSQGLVLGSELVTNGGPFADTTGWAADNVTLSAVGGKLRVSAASIGGFATQTITTTSGKYYKVVISGVDNVSGNSWDFGWGGVFYPPSPVSTSTGGSLTLIVLASASSTEARLRTRGSASSVVDFGSISIKAIPGNHAVAANGSTARPVLRNRYQLLTYSEQFDVGAAWTKTNATVTANAATAPDGTVTADILSETAVSGQHLFLQSLTLSASTYTWSIYAKLGNGSKRWLSMYPQGTGVAAFAIFDLELGTVTSTGLSQYLASSITSVGNGWYRCSIKFTGAATSVSLVAYLRDSSTQQAASYIGDGTSGIYIWGAQLTTAADHDAINGEYQRIEAAPTVGAAPTYDDNPSKFPVYLYATTDDAMSTASIDFSSGDEMSVFAGVTKAQDVLTAHIVELSANSSTTPGAFNLLAPSFSGANSYRILSGGTATAVAGNGVFAAAPDTSVITGLSDISDDVVTLRRNGSLVETSTTDQGTGNYGNYPLYLFSRANSSVFLQGRLYSLIVRNALTSGAELTNTESYVAQKTGVTL